MPNNPSAAVRLTIDAALSSSKTIGGLAWNGSFSFVDNLTDGSGFGQIQVIYAAERTIVSGGTDNFDLAPLADPIGTSSNCVELVGLLIMNRPADPDATPNTTNLSIGNHATAPLTAFLSGTGVIGPIRPGGVFFIMCDDAAGLGPITATTADILRIDNSVGASAKVQVIVFARTS